MSLAARTADPPDRFGPRRGRRLPRRLRDALTAAGFRTLADLAAAINVKPQTLAVVRCGERRVTPAMAARIGKALRLPANVVPDLMAEQLPTAGRS